MRQLIVDKRVELVHLVFAGCYRLTVIDKASNAVTVYCPCLTDALETATNLASYGYDVFPQIN